MARKKKPSWQELWLMWSVIRLLTIHQMTFSKTELWFKSKWKQIWWRGLRIQRGMRFNFSSWDLYLFPINLNKKLKTPRLKAKIFWKLPLRKRETLWDLRRMLKLQNWLLKLLWKMRMVQQIKPFLKHLRFNRLLRMLRWIRRRVLLRWRKNLSSLIHISFSTWNIIWSKITLTQEWPSNLTSLGDQW